MYYRHVDKVDTFRVHLLHSRCHLACQWYVRAEVRGRGRAGGGYVHACVCARPFVPRGCVREKGIGKGGGVRLLNDNTSILPVSLRYGSATPGYQKQRPQNIIKSKMLHGPQIWFSNTWIPKTTPTHRSRVRYYLGDLPIEECLLGGWCSCYFRS
jgi:hypothetical protein